MKREILEFLKRERDLLAAELHRIRAGERRVIHVNSGEHDISETAGDEIESRLLRFEELIAASESRLA